MRKQLNITWSQFEACNPDAEAAFENMCRILFNDFFFDGKGLLHSDPNNPGVEVIPITHKQTGKRISFQAKYLEKRDYTQIKHSAKKAIQYYAGNLDVIYLYCNKDLTVESKQYKDIAALLSQNGISLVPITNQTILEQVLCNEAVSRYYFDQRTLSEKWFNEHLRISLSLLGPRYNREFNVHTTVENRLNVFLHSDSAVSEINKHRTDLIHQLKSIQIDHSNCRESVKRIIDGIFALKDISCETVADCLLWSENIKNEYTDEICTIQNLIIEKERIRENINESEDYKLHNQLTKEIANLNYILTALDNVGMDSFDRALLQEKLLIVTGEAGAGKSQLLANAAEKLRKEGRYVLLMLGNTFLNEEPIINQITRQLELDFEFYVLLDKLEILGRETECTVCLFVDAINESPYRSIWKIGFPMLIEKISKYSHLKMVVSVRSGYERLVFNEEIIKKIESNEILNIIHNGFKEESMEATLTFLNYYGIPFLPEYFLQSEMTNPLFLTLFCKYYGGGDFDIFTLFNRLIQKAEEEAQRAARIEDFSSVLQYLVDELAMIRLSKENWRIAKSELFSLHFWDTYGLSSHKIPFVAALERSGFLINAISHDAEYYYLGYNLLEDFVCAKQILKSHSDKEKLLLYIQDNLLKIGDGEIRNYANIDIFIVLCSFYAECCHDECFTPVFDLITDTYQRNDLSYRYIKSFAWRKASSINRSDFVSYIRKYNPKESVVFQVLIENSTKENHPLNAVFLHDTLIGLSIIQRDYFWTIYINGLANNYERLFQLIAYFNNGNVLNGLSQSNIELLLILFIWLLTSSNRMLRDNASKASVELLKRNFSLCRPLLQRFEKVNDPYVLQRLFGIVFGACTKRCNPDMDIYQELAQYVYNFVFNQENIYPDILLRDYARLILERWMYEMPDKCRCFDVNKFRPPYGSKDIPLVEHQEYVNKRNNINGFNAIAFSMNIDDAGCPGIYGDFGRYIFQATLKHFEKIDIVNLYHYTMQYIRDTIGYSDELFGNYDGHRMQYNYDRHGNKKIERIGKKYQWIAFYHILARVCDNYSLKDFGEEPHPYEGAWNLYVRDFDPTLNTNFLMPNFLPLIQCPEREEDVFLHTTSSTSEEEICEWASRPTSFFEDFSSKLILVDANSTQWVNLKLYDSIKKNKSSNGNSQKEQEIWLTVYGYFIEESIFEIAEKEGDLPRFYKNFPRELDLHQLFNREYPWSPGCQCIYQPSYFETGIEIGERKLVKEFEDFPELFFTEEGGFEFRTTKREIEKFVPQSIIHTKVIPASTYLRWEIEYDASQDEGVTFCLPCKEIVDLFNLKQKEYNGYFFSCNDELVCFDASLSGICDGLLIRKDYLERFLVETGLKLIWIGTGEKQFFCEEFNQIWKRWEGIVFFREGRIEGDLKLIEES